MKSGNPKPQPKKLFLRRENLGAREARVEEDVPYLGGVGARCESVGTSIVDILLIVLLNHIFEYGNL